MMKIKNLLFATVLSLIFFLPSHSLENIAPKQSHSKNHTIRTIETIYGQFEIVDPVIVELIDCDIVQRMKKIDQYGISDNPSFSRYEHSIGVWALLKKFGASQQECIAGLLHDTSHTVFSHVGDKIFKHSDKTSSYQDNIHQWYLQQTSVHAILKKYDIPFDVVIIENKNYLALEQDLPDVCIDRLEYNLRGGLVEGLISQKDIDGILDNIKFEHGVWFFTDINIARKFSIIPLFLTEHVWGSHNCFVKDAFLVQALRRALSIDLVSLHDIHFSTDDIVWKTISDSDDPIIKKNMNFCRNYRTLYSLGSEDHFDKHFSCKFRGIDPWVKQKDGTLKRLSKIDKAYCDHYTFIKNKMTKGWFVKFVDKNLCTDGNYLEKVFS